MQKKAKKPTQTKKKNIRTKKYKSDVKHKSKEQNQKYNKAGLKDNNEKN